MTKTIKCLAAALLLVFGASNASALQYTFVNWHWSYLIQGGSPATGSFDIAPPYDPASQQLISAQATFWFTDDNIFGDTRFGDGQETAQVTITGGFSGSTTVDFLSSVSGSVLGDAFLHLDDHGVLTYNVRATQGDLRFIKAVLCVEVGERANVPDGGVTVALLGLGVCGLALLRRKY